ncbi:MAG: hypothetical protein KTR25_07170 [Myxococcales bacterium]|nr:hypothetical protein [Myxococcales bacterium]
MFVRLATITLVVTIVGVELLGKTALAQLPNAHDFIENLDLECYEDVSGEKPSPSILDLRHINPVMDGLTQRVELGALQRVCLPVQKNNHRPPSNVLPYVRWVDLACYRARALDPEPLNNRIHVKHLNPVLSGLPENTVKITHLAEVCTPVRKNNQPPVFHRALRLVRHIDIACYELEQPTDDVLFPLVLEHLNPVVRAMNHPNRHTQLRRARQLCLPVQKNTQEIPDDVLDIVRWVDFLRYAIEPVEDSLIPLRLKHMNPLWNHLPRFSVELNAKDARHLMVPISKQCGVDNEGRPCMVPVPDKPSLLLPDYSGCPACETQF